MLTNLSVFDVMSFSVCYLHRWRCIFYHVQLGSQELTIQRLFCHAYFWNKTRIQIIAAFTKNMTLFYRLTGSAADGRWRYTVCWCPSLVNLQRTKFKCMLWTGCHASRSSVGPVVREDWDQMNERTRQVAGRITWQQIKHARLYNALLPAWKEVISDSP